MYVFGLGARLTPESRGSMAKFIEREKRDPVPFHVGTYSVVRSYLKAIEAANSTDSKTYCQDVR